MKILSGPSAFPRVRFHLDRSDFRLAYLPSGQTPAYFIADPKQRLVTRHLLRRQVGHRSNTTASLG